LEYAPRDSDDSVVFADLDPELDGLLLDAPAASSGKVKNIGGLGFYQGFVSSLNVLLRAILDLPYPNNEDSWVRQLQYRPSGS
jgi:hypothetical protein